MNPIKANGTSVKNIHGTEWTLNVYNPTPAEWTAHFKRGIERLVEDYNQHKVANNLASGVKSAMAVHLKLDTAPEKPSDETVTNAARIAKMLKDGATFDLRDFVAKDGRAASDKRTPINDFAGKCALITAKWDASDKKAAFLITLKLPADMVGKDAKTVLAAFEAAYKADVKVETETLL